MNKRWKISFNSPVILGFAGVCFLVMLINMATGGRSNDLLFVTYHSSLRDPLTYVRFFTYIFGHDGWTHFIGNMGYILLLGPLLEEKYGSVRILQIIAITAVVTSLINYIFFWNVALCGASGICFAFILLSSFTSLNEREIPLTFLLVAAIYLGQQIYDGITANDNISNLGHIIGGVIGAIVGFVLNRRTRKGGRR